MNIGVLGGTFDPVHTGHVLVAEEAKARLNLTEVLFVPAGLPWLRGDSLGAAAEHRVHMVRLAIDDKPYFKLSTIEVERSGPSYAVDTIAELKGQLGAGDELFFILGWGSLAELPEWREPSRLITMCRLVTVPRVGFPAPDLDSLETSIPGLADRVILLGEPRVDISASEIRGRVNRGLPIDHLVPEPVERYIREQGLYTTA